jgi:hypothetical protein
MLPDQLQEFKKIAAKFYESGEEAEVGSCRLEDEAVSRLRGDTSARVPIGGSWWSSAERGVAEHEPVVAHDGL